MKGIIFSISLIIVALAGYGQYSSPIFLKPNNSFGTIFNGGSFDSVLYFPTGCGVPTDTTFLHAQQNGGKAQKLRKWAIYGDSCGGLVYLWNPHLQSWSPIGSGADSNKLDSVGRKAGSDSVFWYANGVKTFAFRDTATLATVLGALGYAPLAPSDTIGKWVSSVKWSNDSLYYQKNGVWVFIHVDSAGGGGITYPNTANKYLNGYGNFPLLNTDSITQGPTNKFFVAADTANLSHRIDTVAAKTFNLYVRRLGQPGDTTLSAHDSIINDAAQRDSSTSCIHHIINPDGSWTWYTTCGTGTAFDSLTTQGGVFHTGAFNDGRYRTFTDTAYAHFLMTRAWGYKISDSIFAAMNTALAGKVNNLGGSSGINRGAFLSRPSASSVPNTYYWSIDSVFYSYSDGTTWKDLKSGFGGGGITQVFGKNSIIPLGTDTVQLNGDVPLPNKFNYYGTSIIDSSRGFYPNEEYSNGQFYNKATWADATTGFINIGSANVVQTAGKLVFTGGATDGSKALLINFPTMLDKWEEGGTFTVGTKNATATDGFAVGKYSINTTAPIHLFAKFQTSTTGGFVQILGFNSTNGAQLAISPTALSFSISDSIGVSLERDGYVITAKARNITTNSAPIIAQYFFTTDPAALSSVALDNSGDFAVITYGGNFTVDSLFAGTKYPRSAMFMMGGDSKVQGFDVVNQMDRMTDQIGLKISSTINGGGGSDKSIEMSACVPSIILMHPKQFLNLILSNDVRAGVDSTTYCTRYDSINTALKNAGIDVYVGVLYEASVNVLPIWHHIQQVYPASKIINLYDPMKIPGALAADNIHPLSFGDSLGVNAILKSYKIYGQNERYSTPPANYIWNQSRIRQPAAAFNISGTGKAAIFNTPTAYVGSITNEILHNVSLGTSATGQGVLVLGDTTATTDAKFADVTTIGNHFYFRFLADNGLSATNFIDGLRSGITATSMTIPEPLTVSSVAGTSNLINLLAPINNSAINITGSVTGFSKPINLSASATAGLQLFISNSSTNAGAYTNVNLSTGGSGSGSPTIAFGISGSNQYYLGENRNTGNFQIEAGQNFFSEWTATHLLIIKPTGEFGIGGTVPVASAQLMMTSTTQGFLPPRMTTTQQNAIGSPATGLIIWNTDSLCLCQYNGTAWLKMLISSNLTGYALTSGTLAQFAATTSAQLAGVLSDETGTGAVVFGTSPTLSNPVVGTQTPGDNTAKAASTAFVTAAISTIAAGNPFPDNTALVKNNADNTKLAVFSAVNITTATTRTYTLPNVSGILATINNANTWTGVQDMTGSTITVPTQAAHDSSANAASTKYVDQAVANAYSEKLIFGDVLSTSISNTTTETTLISPFGYATGSTTIPANFLTTGKILRYKITGNYSTTTVTPGNLTIRIKIGGATIASTIITNLVGSVSGATYTITGNIFVSNVTGTATNCWTDGIISYGTGSALSARDVADLNNSAGATSINTTISNPFDITAQWATANSLNIITGLICTLETQN